MAFKTLKHNLIDSQSYFEWPSWLPQRNYSVNTLLKSYKNQIEKLAGKITLIAGGLPCQGFSINGRRQPDDRRNKLVNSYIQLVKLIKPQLLFFENVRGFTMEYAKAGGGMVYSNSVSRRLEKLGYGVHAEIVDFSQFSVPQRRLRYILVGVKNGDPKVFFEAIKRNHKTFYTSKGLKKRYSVAQVIADLQKSYGEVPSIDSVGFMNGIYGSTRNQFQRLMRRNSAPIPDSHRFVNHRVETVETFSKILRKARRDKHLSQSLKKELKIKKRSITPLAADVVSPTLTSLPDDLIHYSEPRVLTVREYARIQTFDDAFHFKGAYTSGGNRRTCEVPRYTQIGNAIPPLFAEQAGRALLQLMRKK